MSFGGFDKNSGPGTGPGAPPSFGNLPRGPSPSPPRPVSSGNEQLNWGVGKVPSFKEHGAQTYQRSPDLLSRINSSNGTPTEIQNTRRTSSPYYQSADAISNNSRSAIVRTLSPPVYQKDQYVGGQLPHAGGVKRTQSPPVYQKDHYVGGKFPHAGGVKPTQSPPVYQKNQYVGGQLPHAGGVKRTQTPPIYQKDHNVGGQLPHAGGVKPTRSPPVYQKDQYVGGQLSHAGGVKPRPFSSPIYPGQLRPSSYNNTPPTRGFSPILTTEGTYRSGPIYETKNVDVPLSGQTRSSTPPSTRRDSTENTVFHPPGHKRSLIDYRDLDAPEEMPSPSLATESSFSARDASRPFSGSEKTSAPSHTWGSQMKSSGNNIAPLVQEDTPSFLTGRATYQSGKTLQTKSTNSSLSKRTRSPTTPPTNDSFPENAAIDLDANKRPPDFQRQSLSSMSGQTNRAEVALDKSMQFPAVKRTKTPLPSSSNQGFQENLDPAEESERELQAKAKRLARFKDELSQPVQINPTVRNQSIPTKRQHQSLYEKQQISEDPTVDVMGDSSGGNFIADNEGMTSSGVIVGLCPDMCPESERAERERKGDLDQYERVDGDRNLTSEFLAVKKYTRTAEREARLIRSMPILQKTMDYLLDLLSEPYSDRFLGLYNFLWDRMRAIRMDLRMQHIFNLEAINMLEQMIRLHIIAMHELCEYTKGEGFSEGFDAHLNIEQMNKTSVELFQLYDDHRKKGIHVPSEREFRGYYALLKLDKHPGYKVEPAELSLDLAKMTPEIRQTSEVLFARDDARACRTGNYILFFRLANKASYLQACLMHAHFSKLRTLALSSLHSGLQINQGIPVAHVANWLGMEEEGMDELLEYHGFSVKDFNEPYMMKENAFINADTDFPIKRSKLVDRKRSETIASDVSFPSQTESYAAKEVPQVQLKKNPEPTLSRTVSSFAPISTRTLHDEEMHDLRTIPSPKASVQSPKIKTSFDLPTPDEKLAPASPFVFNFSQGSAENNQMRVDSPQKSMFEPVFRNSFGRSSEQDSATLPPPITLDKAEELRFPVSPRDSVVHAPIPQPLSTENLEDEEQMPNTEEDESDEVTTNYYDQEVADAKLRLILRIWKRRTSKKKQLRELKQLAASVAMNLLSMGPPMWQYEAPLSNYGMLDIDHVMNERYEMQERSLSVLNPSYVVAAKLAEKNPDSKCLCWKVAVLVAHEDDIGLQNEATQSWFHSKLMPANSDCDLIVASPGLAIWRSWIPSLSGIDSTCCLSVIKNTTLNSLNETITGTDAVVFILSDYSPLEHQKKSLHDLVASLPANSRLPLLILGGMGKGEQNASSIAKDLELHYIDKSRVVGYYFTFLKAVDNRNLVGFFSDERLREGLEWLASESPPQIVVNEIKTRELVLSYLNPTLEILDETNTPRIGPNNCISAFNESLDRSKARIIAAVNANPTGWPCPEIDMIEQTSDEYKATAWYLPRIGWSSVCGTEVLIQALNNSALPPFEDDLSWLSRGMTNNNDIESQVSSLENCLVNYLTGASWMMGVALAEKEARITMQKFSQLELHGSAYYIIPQWVSIFRRIFNWRLMNLTEREVSSTYVLPQDSSCEPSSNILNNFGVEAVTFSSPYVVNPSLDELVEVGCHLEGLETSCTEHEAFPEWSADVPTSNYDIVPMENEENISVENEENHDGVVQVVRSKEADKLSELLEKCNIMQNTIDKKLSIYF